MYSVLDSGATIKAFIYVLSSWSNEESRRRLVFRLNMFVICLIITMNVNGYLGRVE